MEVKHQSKSSTTDKTITPQLKAVLNMSINCWLGAMTSFKKVGRGGYMDMSFGNNLEGTVNFTYYKSTVFSKFNDSKEFQKIFTDYDPETEFLLVVPTHDGAIKEVAIINKFYCLSQAPPTGELACNNFTASTTKRCGGCKRVAYCNKDCMAKDRPQHKEACRLHQTQGLHITAVVPLTGLLKVVEF